MDSLKLRSDAAQLMGLQLGQSPQQVQDLLEAPNFCIEQGQHCAYGPNNGLRLWFDEQQRLRRISLQTLDDEDPIIPWLGKHLDFEQLRVATELIRCNFSFIQERYGPASKEDFMGNTLLFTYHLPELRLSFSFQKKRCVQIDLYWSTLSQ